jgi:mono/diheme cytochrome c family protein
VAGDAEIGRQLLHDKGCLECHSLGGDGGRTAGDLEQVRDVAEPASLIAGLWNHVLLAEAAGEGRMGPWSTFSPEEMADVAAFLQELEAKR